MSVVSEHTGFGAFKAGFARLSGAWRLTWSLYVVNLLWAVLWSLPLLWTLFNLLEGRPAGDRLAQRWDLEIVVELILDNPELPRLVMALAAFSVIGYALFSVFLTAGVASAAGENVPPSVSETARSGVEAFGRVLLMSVFYLLVLAVAFFLLAVLLAIGSGVAEDMSGVGKFITQVIFALPALALFLYADSAMDYSRIYVANHRGRGTFVRGLVFGLKMPFRRAGAAMWLHLGFSLISLAAAAILVLLPTDFDAGGSVRLLVGFVLWQLLVFFRVAVRVAGITGQKLYGQSEKEWTA